MLQVLINFATLNALNSPPEVYIGLAAIWVLLLSAGIASVVSRARSAWVAAVWIVFILIVPIAGLFVYCVWCMLSADYSFLKMFGLHRQTASYLRAASLRNK